MMMMVMMMMMMMRMTMTMTMMMTMKGCEWLRRAVRSHGVVTSYLLILHSFFLLHGGRRLLPLAAAGGCSPGPGSG